MAISKLNADQFSALNSNFSGVVLEYAGKDGNNSAIHFFGKDYEATGKTQDEMLRVVKNVMSAHWLTKAKETELRQQNDGIRCKLRASTPLKIHIHTDKGETVKVYDLENSEWAKIGLMPTKVDLERSKREKSQTIHKAAIAMLEALKFRVELPKEKKIEPENALQNPVVPVVDANQTQPEIVEQTPVTTIVDATKAENDKPKAEKEATEMKKAA